jgi:hypothetical protein
VNALHLNWVANNLAAVLIQLNDTYLIHERAGVPGLARIASFVKEVRQQVADALGSDRTLVLHAGDFLSPSLMSVVFKGTQMVDLLHHCQIDFATTGNHEFDFGRHGAAASRDGLSQDRGKSRSARRRYGPRPLAFWPEPNPFIAITGIAGEQTRSVPEGKGWKACDPEATLGSVIDRVSAMP